MSGFAQGGHTGEYYRMVLSGGPSSWNYDQVRSDSEELSTWAASANEEVNAFIKKAIEKRGLPIVKQTSEEIDFCYGGIIEPTELDVTVALEPDLLKTRHKVDPPKVRVHKATRDMDEYAEIYDVTEENKFLVPMMKEVLRSASRGSDEKRNFEGCLKSSKHKKGLVGIGELVIKGTYYTASLEFVLTRRIKRADMDFLGEGIAEILHRKMPEKEKAAPEQGSNQPLFD